MSTKIEEQNFVCYAVDEDTAVMKLANESYVLDYSTLMELVMNLVNVTSQMEKDMDVDTDKQATVADIFRNQNYVM